MKISNTLSEAAGGLGLFSLLWAGAVFVQLSPMSADGRVVNYAGIVRGGTLRLVKLELADEAASKSARALRSTNLEQGRPASRGSSLPAKGGVLAGDR